MVTKTILKRSVLVSMLTVFLGAAACANLQPVDMGVCGNLVVEVNEECDGPTETGLCLPPGDPLACRLSCREGSGCPEGKVCGTNELCLEANRCGNGVLEEGEDCDGDAPDQLCHPADSGFACRFACTETSDCPDGYKCLETGVCDSKNVCGNGVVEAGEDCDGAPEDGSLVCGGSQDTWPCRFACDTSACPEGFFCDGGLCQQASGNFSLLHSMDGGTDGLVVADFDGDGKSDLLQATQNGVRIYFVDGEGGIKESNALNIGQVAPVVGDLNEDGVADLAFRSPSLYLNGASELSVASVVGDRLQIVPQLGEKLPGLATVVEALSPALQDDLLFYDKGDVTGWSLQPSVSKLNNDVVVFGVSSGIESGISTGSLLGTTRTRSVLGCDRMALAFRASTEVHMLASCREPDSLSDEVEIQFNTANTATTEPSFKLQMPGGYLPHVTNNDGRPNRGGAVFQGDVNGDGFTDVLVPVSGHGPKELLNNSLGCKDDNVCSVTDDDCVCQDCLGKPECFSCDLDQVCNPFAESCSCSDCAGHPSCGGLSSVQVAFGRSDGSYASQPEPQVGLVNQTETLGARLIANYKCGKQEGMFAAPWLATAHLTDDQRIDVVTGNGIYVDASATSVGAYELRFCPSQPWLDAEVGDFDGNGYRDVVAVRGGATLSFVRADKNGAFSETSIELAGFVLQIASGDFDGDTLDDVAMLVSEIAKPGPSDPVAIMVSYGRPFQSLEEPQLVGSLRGLTQLVAGRFTADNVADLLVAKPEGQASILQGSVQRQMLSSLVPRNVEAQAYAVGESVTNAAALAFGKFAPTGADSFVNNLAMLTNASQVSGAQAALNLRIEIVGANAAGRLQQNFNDPFTCTEVSGLCATRALIAIDIDGDGFDTLLALSSGKVEFIDGGIKSTLTATEDVAGLELFSGGRNAVHSTMVGRPVVRDVDVDGDDDLAMLRNDGSVAIVLNDGGLDFGKSAVVTADGGTPIRAFAFMEQGVGLPPLLIAATNQAVHRFAFGEGGTYTLESTLDGVSGGDSLAVLDVNGDNVPDLVVGEALRFRIYQAGVQKP